MKKLINIIKIAWVLVFSAFIVFEVYILINSSEIAEFSEATNAINEALETHGETDEVELEVLEIPLADFAIEETIGPEPSEEPKEPETEPEPETEIQTETSETTAETTEAAATEAKTEPMEPKELILKNMPILMYHTSSEADPGGLVELYVKPSEFEKQIQYLSENGFTFCTFDDYYNLDAIDKPVFITFDDGYRANYTEIFPVITKHNAKITIFLMISNMEAENFSFEMIKEMSDSGLVKFESHTLTHPDLSSISSNDAWLTREIKDSKMKIEEMTGKRVVALAYPAGKFNETVKTKIKEFYYFGLRADLGMHRTDFDLFEVRRIRINRSTSLANFINLIG
ncbi:MAG: polysaccharide deacetylase family protein [Oscillospiraceae bacterium]|nr:polysaccharide deacetylase family protein [Oscillospiraceae bacterium]